MSERPALTVTYDETPDEVIESVNMALARIGLRFIARDEDNDG